MARIVEKLPFHRRKAPPMEPESAAARAETSRTLGELLKRVGDTTEQQNDDGGGNDPQAQDYTIEVEGLAARSPQQPPFVLSFSGLEYSVNKPRRLRFAGWLRRRLGGSAAGAGESGATALEQTPGNSGEKKILLDSISGEAKEGEILAVLGASGSGKSTLIDALANRIRRKSLRGSITLNGETLESRQLKVISAYVMQDDLLFPMLTVEETLMYAAEFRLPRSLSKSKKKARVKDLINQLGLSAAANTVIGDEGHRGISGGERRRVSIGADIIHDPILLFLDEPTSGLDSTSAFTVVKVLKRIAQNGSIVIMSVHQPSSRIVGLLDSLIFLSRGQAIYNGSPEGLPRFFSKFGHPIPDSENRCEFALDLVRELEASPSGTKDLVDFNRRWQVENGSSPRFQRGEGSAQFQPSLSFKDTISASISRGKLVSSAHREPIVGKNAMSTFANPFWVEMWVLSHRSFVNSRRMPELFCIRLGAVVVTGFILATIFWKLDPSPKGAQERLGFFAFAMSTTFYTCADALPVFLHERYVFMRETAYNAYRRSSYVLSNVFVSFPSLVLLSLTFAAITFFPVGLAGGFKGFVFYFLVILASFWAGNSFVTFLSGVVSHIMLGFTIVVAILAYFLLFSGFFIARQRIPLYWRWFHYMSLVKYPYEAVMLNEFDDHSLCFVRGEQIFDNSPLSNLSLETKEILLAGMSRVIGVNISSSTCVTTGPDILRQQGVTDLTKWQCIWITVAWGILFRLLFYVALLLGSKNKRK